jgi:hypothetical protein
LKSEVNPEIIDTTWYLESLKYIATLTDRQRYALYVYTHHGDVYVNMIERGRKLDYNNIYDTTIFYEFVVYMSNPNNSKFVIKDDLYKSGLGVSSGAIDLVNMNDKDYRVAMSDKSGIKMFALFNKFTTSGIVKVMKPIVLYQIIKSLSHTMSSTIKKSPSTTKPMVVFRGVTDSFFTANNFKGVHKKDEVYYNKGFVSTSLKYRSALNSFTKQETECCFKVITVLPGTKCIPLVGLTRFQNEFEILFDRNVKFIIRDKYTTKIPTRARVSITNDPNYINMKISDIMIG